MPKYRKKPVVIEAFKLDGSEKELFELPNVHRVRTGTTDYTRFRDDYESKLGDVALFMHPDPEKEKEDVVSYVEIETLEGTARVEGDTHMLMIGVEGERYSCELGIFDKTYEPA